MVLGLGTLRSTKVKSHHYFQSSMMVQFAVRARIALADVTELRMSFRYGKTLFRVLARGKHLEDCTVTS